MTNYQRFFRRNWTTRICSNYNSLSHGMKIKKFFTDNWYTCWQYILLTSPFNRDYRKYKIENGQKLVPSTIDQPMLDASLMKPYILISKSWNEDEPWPALHQWTREDVQHSFRKLFHLYIFRNNSCKNDYSIITF